MGYRKSRGVLTLLMLAVVAAGCSTQNQTTAASQAGTPTQSPTTRTWSIVALGDSVPAGANCDCTPYPQLTAQAYDPAPQRTVTAINDAVGGYTTSDVLQQLQSGSAVAGQVSKADAIEIEIGANDVAYSQTCGKSLECYTTTIPVIEKNLTGIVNRVHELTAGHQILVVLLDYWSVWLGGAYAQAQGEAYVATAAALTSQVSAAVATVAASTHSAFVDLRAAFKGPDYAYDETHYLSDDGDHPNAAGHHQIAVAAAQVIDATLRITSSPIPSA